MSPLARVPVALQAYKDAEERLAKAMERAYPLGAIVAATIGNARIRGVVTSVAGTGYYRGHLWITNEVTGKGRHFYAADRSLHDVELIALPDNVSGVARP